jgi:transposase
MWSLTAAVRIYVYREAVDMRKSFDGLAALVSYAMGGDPLDGSLYVFCNRRRNRVKVLYWDRDGYALWAKRLEQGRFRLPALDAESCEVDPATLTMMLEGIVPLHRSKRYKRP